jgi:preprotein translocase subunit SecA
VSENEAVFWRNAERAAGPYGEVADKLPGKLDRFLLGMLARLRRPLALDLRQAKKFAGLVETLQPGFDALNEAELKLAAQDLRTTLLRKGFTFEASARAFALVRAASIRTLGIRHYPVQIMGGYTMLCGRIAEMATGEGKTLTATLPAAAVALAGLPVHVVTVNDYLARRDAEWMTPLYNALGLSVGVTDPEQSPEQRRQAYAADICYCTNKDIGFDYLRDSLVLAGQRGRGRLLLDQAFNHGDSRDRLLLRGLYFAVVDEIDSILIDEARTPLIIAGNVGGEEDRAFYDQVLTVARELRRDVDFAVEVADRMVALTESGRQLIDTLKAELPPVWRSRRAREEMIEQALAALHLYERDTHYLLRDDKVQIIDEYTGRIMADRSWERGLHQLIEAKESCEQSGRRGTLARITYQRLFRRYIRLSGMSGTVQEVAPELDSIFNLRTVCIPPNQRSRRKDFGVRLFGSHAAKWQAVAAAATHWQECGRPVLIGTRSVAASEELSAILHEQGLSHQVLNARQDAEEAAIIAGAGIQGQVTVATNMAGRGTDILLDANSRANGGLHVILTEFHESRRIDRQLSGRAARQGDPGSTEAIVSLDDDIFRRHAARITQRLSAHYAGSAAPLPAVYAWVLRHLAQSAAEWANAQTRRATLEIDKKLDTAMGFAGRAE